MDRWTCEQCGRENPGKRGSCLLCGRSREGARSPAEVLNQGSRRLAERYGVPVELGVYGGMQRLTTAEARAVVAEAEALLVEEFQARAGGSSAIGSGGGYLPFEPE